MRLRLKYCGGCNPEIDRGAVADGFVGLLEAASVNIRIVDDHDPADITILLNGCAHACKEEELKAIPAFSPYLSVQGEKLRYQPVSEDQIPRALFEMVKPFLVEKPR